MKKIFLSIALLSSLNAYSQVLEPNDSVIRFDTPVFQEPIQEHRVDKQERLLREQKIRNSPSPYNTKQPKSKIQSVVKRDIYGNIQGYYHVTDSGTIIEKDANGNVKHTYEPVNHIIFINE